MLSPGAAFVGVAVMLANLSQPADGNATLARQSVPAPRAVVLAKNTTTGSLGGTVMQVSPPASSTTSGVQNFPIMQMNPTLGTSPAGVQNFPIMQVSPPAHGVGAGTSATDLPVMRVDPPHVSVVMPALKGSQN